MVIDTDIAVAHVNIDKKEVAAVLADNSKVGKAKANGTCCSFRVILISCTMLSPCSTLLLLTRRIITSMLISPHPLLISYDAAKCPKCEHPEAWFHQMQTRSADEASTIFYECGNPKCGFKWNEN